MRSPPTCLNAIWKTLQVTSGGQGFNWAVIPRRGRIRIRIRRIRIGEEASSSVLHHLGSNPYPLHSHNFNGLLTSLYSLVCNKQQVLDVCHCPFSLWVVEGDGL
jgi:hypothetical protein